MIIQNISSVRIYSRIVTGVLFKKVGVRNMSTEDDIITESIGDKGVITLNRPKALNALNLSMVNKIQPKLMEWEKEKKTLVLIKGAGGRAFCSGGDIRALVVEGFKGNRQLGYDFFRKEYTLNGYIGSYKIPYVAFIDGIVMGGGVGLSVHGKYRVATEKSLFAMPESAIGLFADVGTSYVLPRLKGKLGWYLALTGQRLKGSDIVRAGIGTHYCESSKLNDLEAALLNSSNEASIQRAFNNFCVEYDALPEFSLNPLLECIDYCFSAQSVEGILKRLKDSSSNWAKQTLTTLSEVSPTSVKVTFHELNLGAKMSLKDCLAMEYRLAVASMNGHDFYEGVRALLIDKDKNPKWKPASYEEVTQDQVLSYFRKLPEEQELKHKL